MARLHRAHSGNNHGYADIKLALQCKLQIWSELSKCDGECYTFTMKSTLQRPAGSRSI